MWRAPISPRSQRRVVLAIAIVAGIGFIYLAVRHLDFAAIRATWRDARPFPWVPLAVASYLLGHVVRGERCRRLLRRDTALRLGTASNIVVVGYASNNVLPARLGELVRCGMLVERTGIPIAQAFTVTFVERVLDGVAILLLLVVASAGITHGGWLAQARIAGSVVFGGAALVIVMAVLLPGTLVSLVSRASALLGSRWHERAIRIATSVTNGVACLRRPSDALGLTALSLLVWLLESGMFLCILPAFGLPPAARWAVVAMSITNLGLLLPSTPGFVGPFHFFCSQALILFGVPSVVAVSYAILVHLAFFVPITLWGVGAVLWYGVELGSTAAAARAARLSPGASVLGGVPVHLIARVDALGTTTGGANGTTARPVPELYLALVDAMIPREDVSQETITKVAEFLHAQIGALPRRLRTQFELGMAGFRAFVRIRHFASFCGMSSERRRAAVNAWAFGPIGLLRQLFRPVRSVTLLAFYELTRPTGARARPAGALPIATVHG